MADSIQDQLASAEAVLQAGIVQTSQDGATATFDLDRIEKHARDLRNQSLYHQANGLTRPVMMRVNYSRYGS